MPIDESELLASIAARSADLSARFPQVLEGPGDDCAVIGPGSGHLLLTVDQLVEGRHFRPGTPIDLIARKAIARSISDIAAMAGTPIAALATGVLPQGFEQTLADQLCQRLKHWSEHWGCPLVGGDIASSAGGRDPLVLTVTVVGRSHASRGPVLRRSAVVGDDIYVTGTLGSSFEPATGLGRHLTFEPRIDAARTLADRLGPNLHAMMDLSDGLGRDAGRMAAASDVTFEIDAASIPAAPAASWQGALRDGEDYELLFTATGSPPTELPSVAGPVRVTRIGRVVAKRSHSLCVVRTPDGTALEASEIGWNH